MGTTSNVSDRADAAFGAAGVLDYAGPAPRSTLRPLVRVMRPYQWVKNLLLALPLVMSHRIDGPKVGYVALAIAAFSLFARFIRFATLPR